MDRVNADIFLKRGYPTLSDEITGLLELAAVAAEQPRAATMATSGLTAAAEAYCNHRAVKSRFRPYASACHCHRGCYRGLRGVRRVHCPPGPKWHHRALLLLEALHESFFEPTERLKAVRLVLGNIWQMKY